MDEFKLPTVEDPAQKIPESLTIGSQEPMFFFFLQGRGFLIKGPVLVYTAVTHHPNEGCAYPVS